MNKGDRKRFKRSLAEVIDTFEQSKEVSTASAFLSGVILTANYLAKLEGSTKIRAQDLVGVTAEFGEAIGLDIRRFAKGGAE